jgi:hypothetical protein
MARLVKRTPAHQVSATKLDSCLSGEAVTLQDSHLSDMHSEPVNGL